jgi:hypothetical protein
MYNGNGIPTIGAFITGGEDKYFLISSKACCCYAYQVNSASFLNWSIGANALIGLPQVVLCQVGLHELVIPSKLLEHGIWHQVDGSATIDKHLRNRPLDDVTSNVQ